MTNRISVKGVSICNSLAFGFTVNSLYIYFFIVIIYLEMVVVGINYLL